MDDPAIAYSHAFIRRALPDGARRLLEVGCGEGALAAKLQAEGFRLVALDSDPACVEAAQGRGVDARLASWPVDADGGGFDAVLFTRSLHHVEALADGVAAAFEALAPGGRVIVEDFDFGFDDEPSFRWLQALLRTLAAAGLALDGSELLSQLARDQEPPVAVWRGQHHHDLHSAAAIEAALGRKAASLRSEPAAYFFRYAAPLPGASQALVGSLLEFELMAIRLGHIAPLGRRFVAQA